MKTDENQEQLLIGIGASPGIAIAQAYVLSRSCLVALERTIVPEEVAGEIDNLRLAIAKARRQLEEVRAQVGDRTATDHVFIIDTHLMMLDDQVLLAEIVGIIEHDLVNAEGALRRTLKRFRHLFENIDDEYLRERRSDIDFVGERILRNLVGESQPALDTIAHKVVLVAHDLSPADTLQIDRNKVIGFMTDVGGRTSHTAIVARSLGIPAVVGLESATLLVDQDTPVIIDGSSGAVVINPSAETFRDYLQRKQLYEYQEKELLSYRALPAETGDGCRIILRGNLEMQAEAEQALIHGAEGVGLFRTEFLYLNRAQPPNEDEQFRAYKEMLLRMAPHPVTFRTLDIGGDKFAPEISLEGEANPALGLRAIRFSLKEGELFRIQLRAILRASAFGKARILFPMVSGVGEVRACREQVLIAMDELREQGVPFDEGIAVGAMIEIPSAAIIADLLAREVDFFSVGTNDLIQYSLAVDRGNEHVAYLYEPLHPAILRGLRMICAAGNAAGIPVGMCGEMAAEPLYAPLLVGLGFTELSMNAGDIPRVKRIIRRITRSEGETLLAELMELLTGEEIAARLDREMQRRFPEFFGVQLP